MSRLPKHLREEMIHFAESLESILDAKGIDTTDVVFVQLFIMGLSPDEAMTHIIEKILPWKVQIQNRNENFFRENIEIFGNLPPDRVKYFADIVINRIDAEDKNEIWEFFSVFLTFAEEFKKKM